MFVPFSVRRSAASSAYSSNGLGFHSRPVVSIVAPEDGTYFVLAREAAYAGNANCLYRLHVGNFPRPTATVPGRTLR